MPRDQQKQKSQADQSSRTTSIAAFTGIIIAFAPGHFNFRSFLPWLYLLPQSPQHRTIYLEEADGSSIVLFPDDGMGGTEASEIVETSGNPRL